MVGFGPGRPRFPPHALDAGRRRGGGCGGGRGGWVPEHHRRARRNLRPRRMRARAGRPVQRRRGLSRLNAVDRRGRFDRRGRCRSRRCGGTRRSHGLGYRPGRRRGRTGHGGSAVFGSAPDFVADARRGIDGPAPFFEQLDREAAHRIGLAAQRASDLKGLLPGLGIDVERVLLGPAERRHLYEPTHATLSAFRGEGTRSASRTSIRAASGRSTRPHSARRPSAGRSWAAYMAGKIVATKQIPMATVAGSTNSTGCIDTGRREMK